MTIKAIIFDVGNCYLTGSINAFLTRAFDYLGIDDRTFHRDEIVFDPDYNKGLTTIKDSFEKMFVRRLSDKQLETLTGFWTTTWTLDPGMAKLVASLRKRYRLAILSVSDEANSTKYKERGWYDGFDPVVLSHEEGILKPDRRIYEITLERLGLPARECLFIDDQKKNVNAAERLGMHGILYTTLQNLIEDLKEHGIEFQVQ
ncbi:HAD family phosphatase [Candidatus Woesearchaeota archaeon]|nr:HAD family phosphatase [Candidatus Woesearchaeota archaeon]